MVTVFGSFSDILRVALIVSTLTGPAWSQFCSQRPGGCCPGRDDTCTVAKGDTQCYCDEFCLRSMDPDCCPDVANSCKGLLTTDSPLSSASVKADCVFKGKSYYAGDSFEVNCNTCVCLPNANGYDVQCEDNTCLITEEIVARVNSQNYGWQASNYSFLWGLTLEEGIQRRLGTFKPGPAVATMTEIKIEQTDDLPESFDSRQKWPGWIEGVMDQGDCGSSWAVSTAAVASDRLAIQSMGHMRAPLSTQNLLSCNTRGQRGCNGGYLDRAWYYLRKYGVVTDECYPYKSGKYETGKMNEYACTLPRGQTSPCPRNGVTSRKCKMSPPYRISNQEEDIKRELYRNGPLQALMMVKEDFYSYSAGVYRYSRVGLSQLPEHRRTGYHSVRILGWGVDRTNPGNPLPYWLCANSWGNEWGEDGYFRILRGQNECEIESFVLGVWGDVDMEMMREWPPDHILHSPA